MLKMLPQDLDKQSEIKVDRWLEIGSEELRSLDDTPEFTAKVLRLGLSFSEGSLSFLDTDAAGRIWSAFPNDKGRYYPFHFDANGKIFGYKNSKKAAN